MVSQKRKIIKKNITIFLLFILCSVVIAEIFLRTFFYEQLKTRHNPGIYMPDSLFVYNYIPNKTDSIISPQINHKFKLNNQGFFGSDFSECKNDSIFRIILIDDSDGTGLHMNSDNTFCEQLNKIFKRYGFRVEILNCSRNGSNKDIQSMAFIKNKIIRFNPNLIFYVNSRPFTKINYVYETYKDYVLQYDPTDPLSRKKAIERVAKIKESGFLTTLYDKSFIIRWMCYRYISTHSNWNGDDLFMINNEFEILLYAYIKRESKAFCTKYYCTWAKTIKEIKETENLLNKINCQFVLLNYNSYSTETQSFLKEKNLAFFQIEMTDFLNLPLNSRMEGHMNEIGHTIIAQRLFSLLLLNKTIPEKYMPN